MQWGKMKYQEYLNFWNIAHTYGGPWQDHDDQNH